MPVKTKKVLIVEDNEEVRKSICRSVKADIELDVWGEAGSMHAAKSLLGKGFPDVALIDLGLPDGNGVDLIEWLGLSAPEVETLVLSVFGDEHHVVTAIRAGASGYILKSETSENLPRLIKLVLDGQSPISPAVARHILNSAKHLASGGFNSSIAEKPHLTPAEFEILKIIAKGYTASEIAELTNRKPSTVLVHIKNIYKKLSVHNRSEAVLEAVNLGFIKTNRS